MYNLFLQLQHLKCVPASEILGTFYLFIYLVLGQMGITFKENLQLIGTDDYAQIVKPLIIFVIAMLKSQWNGYSLQSQGLQEKYVHCWLEWIGFMHLYLCCLLL